MKKELSAIDAKYEAQKIAFGPMYFQAVVALRELGILQFISNNRKGVSIETIIEKTGVSEYSVTLLLEAAEVLGVVEVEDDIIKISKIGFFLLKDEMTRVNINFMNDVCYLGAKNMTESFKNGKPEGLKVLGNWPTIYEGLSVLPEPAKTSWFEFDHYYSDNAFPEALKIVFRNNPKLIFDVGGNTGKWSFACCKHDPNVRLKILDLPVQLKVAQANATERNLLDRISFHPIDLLDRSQEIPKGADVIWMSQFLDCFSKEQIIQILENACYAASENTTLYILEPFFDNQNFPAAHHSLVATSLYFTIMANGNSKMYRVEVMKDLARQAGFEIVETYPLIGDSYHTILECKKRA
ncbi:methyltransferase [Dyadobacter chenhuakuii]|uniref:SAM-dependent methyltransferase n=1 Tax=Dyadobacter chenhuakuii TaxID=2909339 RepID=A0ABY4XLP0_9BACT|nr:methyltransferase [Dyadobacter chenhuakuii]MCF2493988.1 SAM-dependent methyltransferase [Dyadobacter chenhuakuii]USJ31119.1 SAM-dependent methyltransferase [Dyadobacter chenhuakuii]